MKTNKKGIIQLSLMIILTCLSQITALYKSRFTAMNYGASDYMDAYNFSLEIATFLFTFVTTGVTTVVIPAFVKREDKNALNSFITIIYTFVFALAIIILCVRYTLISCLTNRNENFINTAGTFLIVTFIIQGITAFLAVTTAYYQCIGKFNIPKLIVILSNLIVTVVLMTGKIKTIYMYLSLLVAGSVINCVIDILIAINLGFKYFPKFDIRNPEFQKMLVIFLPTLFSSGVYKIHTLVDTTIATNLVEGQTSILSYSSQILSMINTVIIGNLTTYIYPKIVAKLGQNNVKQILWNYSILFHACISLMVAGFINVGLEGVSLIFLSGKFTSSDVNTLYNCCCIYIFGQQFNIIRDLIYRYFYAVGDTKTTFKNSIIVSSSNIILSLLLVRQLGIYGIALGTVLSSIFSLIMIIIRFKILFGFCVKFGTIILEWAKNILSMVISIAVVRILKTTILLPGYIAPILIYGIVTVLVFSMILLMLRTSLRKIQL